MNATIYVYGNFNDGYTQYPDDCTCEMFNFFYDNAKSITQIAIHRDGDLMYYGYIRKLENNHYIGMCIVLNQLLLTRIDVLFSLFENAVSELVTKGQLIHFNGQGDIVTNVEKLYLNKEEIDLLCDSLCVRLNDFNDVVALPPVSFGNAKDSARVFLVGDDLDEIIKSTYTNGYTFVYKSERYNTDEINSCKELLKRTNEEKRKLLGEIEKLQIENRNIKYDKNQGRNDVILIFIVIFLLFIMLVFVHVNSLNDTKNKLSDTREKFYNLKSEMDSLGEERDDALREIKEWKSKVGTVMPIIIKDVKIANTSYDGDIETDYGKIIYSKNTMYLNPKINYIGVKTGEKIKFNIKLYTPSGLSTGSDSPSGFSYTASIYVYSGDNTEVLGGWGNSSRGNWSRGNYRFEIWYADVCLKSKSFTIY